MAALPQGWKKPLGNDWEDVLSILLWKWSSETYLANERTLKPEQDFHYQFNAQASSLSRRMYKEHGAGLQELQVLKSIYFFMGLIPRCLQHSEERSQGWIPRSLLRGGSLIK